MMSGIQERKGMIVISGEVGVGKTILIYSLLKDLSKKIKTAFIFHPRLDFKGLLKTILHDLEIPIGEKEDHLPSLILHFKTYLNARLSQDETVAIIVDEAQTLDEKVLEELGKLASLDTPAAKLLQILLVGQPELEVMLNSRRLQSLRKRIALHNMIRPLTQREGRGYVRHRLRLVGRDISEIFTSEAVNRVWEFAEGIPRVMNLICDRALLIGYSSSSPIIDSKIVDEAIQDLNYLRSRKSGIIHSVISPIKAHYRMIVLSFLLFSAIGVFLLHRANTPPAKIIRKIPPVEERTVEKKPEIRPAEKRVEERPAEKRAEEMIAVKKGWTLAVVARQYYSALNISLLDFILEANPQITNPNLIFPDQTIKVPPITEESPLIRVSENVYHIHLGTFTSTQEVQLYRDEPLLKGKELRVVPRKVSRRETWYRVMAGKFNSKEEALRLVHMLQEKKLLPLLEGMPGKTL